MNTANTPNLSCRVARMLSVSLLMAGTALFTGCITSSGTSDGPVIIAARMHVKSECVGAFKQLAAPLIETTRQEPGCLQYDFYQEAQDSTVFFFYEVYADRAAQELHSGSDYLARFVQARAPMLSSPSEATIYDGARKR